MQQQTDQIIDTSSAKAPYNAMQHTYAVQRRPASASTATAGQNCRDCSFTNRRYNAGYCIINLLLLPHPLPLCHCHLCRRSNAKQYLLW
jgi:hypothetical protein